MGSMMATTWTDVAAAISASVLNTTTDKEGRKVSQLDKPQLHFVIRKITEKRSEEFKTFSPLSLCPEQVGPQDYGDVTGSHLINIAVLSQFGQKLHQIPAAENLPYNFFLSQYNWYCKFL